MLEDDEESEASVWGTKDQTMSGQLRKIMWQDGTAQDPTMAPALPRFAMTNEVDNARGLQSQWVFRSHRAVPWNSVLQT